MDEILSSTLNVCQYQEVHYRSIRPPLAFTRNSIAPDMRTEMQSRTQAHQCITIFRTSANYRMCGIHVCRSELRHGAAEGINGRFGEREQLHAPLEVCVVGYHRRRLKHGRQHDGTEFSSIDTQRDKVRQFSDYQSYTHRCVAFWQCKVIACNN